MVILKHTDHLQVTNTQLGPQKCFGTNYLKFPKFQFTFTFLFSAKTLLVSQLSQVNCTWFCFIVCNTTILERYPGRAKLAKNSITLGLGAFWNSKTLVGACSTLKNLFCSPLKSLFSYFLKTQYSIRLLLDI